MSHITPSLKIGAPWESEVTAFTIGSDDTPRDLTGLTPLVFEWREHATPTVLLTHSSADGSFVITNAVGGLGHFELTAAQTTLLATDPPEDAYPGQNRRFDVTAWSAEVGGDWLGELDVTART